MAGNLFEGHCSGSVDGVPFVNGSARVKTSGKAATQATDRGVFITPLAGTTTIHIEAPYFGAGNPIKAANLAARLAKRSVLIALTFPISGTVVTAWGMISDEEISSSAAAGSSQTIDFVVCEPMEA